VGELHEDWVALTYLLRKTGCATLIPCQAIGHDLVEIQFRTAEDAMAFLNPVAGRGPHAVTVPNEWADSPFPETLYERITGCGSAGDWKYAVHPDDWTAEGPVEDDEMMEGDTAPFAFPVSVRFPRSDLHLILLRLANASRDPRNPAGPNGHPGHWAAHWEDDDLLWLLLALCRGAIGARLRRPGTPPNRASVTFFYVWQAQAFLSLIVEGSAEGNQPQSCGPGEVRISPDRTGTLSQRITGSCPDEPENWSYEARPIDHALGERVVNGVVVQPRSKPRFDFAVTIQFPTTDLPVVFDRLSRVALDQLQI
jgi:hypothetical protein